MSAGDWDEVKRLAADFQRAQLTSNTQALSERNCVEIIKKLIDSKLLDVIFTTDGKEYITPQYLVKEIKDELYVSGGRVNLVELSKNLNVDLSHISARIPEVERSTTGCAVIVGQLISKQYQKKIADEINDRLKRDGQVIVGDLTKVYDLPGDYLQNVIERNLGKVIHGKQDKSDARVFYTDAFLEKNKGILRGALRALTRPTQLTTILNLIQISERDFFFAFDGLSEAKESYGVLTARQGGNAMFIPQIYTKLQSEWVENFFKQNGYLEYDALIRQGITDPQSFVKRHFPGVGIIELPTCAIGPQLLDQVEAAVEETLVTGSFLDITMLLPSIFSPSDTGRVLESVLKKHKTKSAVHLFCDTVIMTDPFIQELSKPFYEGGILQKSADEAVNSGAYIQAQTEKKLGRILSNKDDIDSKSEKRDERRKKAAGGKTGGGTQGRETKTKSTKKKQSSRAARDEDSGSDNDASTATVKKLQQPGKLELVKIEEIEKSLDSNAAMQDLIDVEGIIQEIALFLHPILNKRATELAAEAYERMLQSSAGERRRAHGDLQERVDSWLMELRLSERGIRHFVNEDTRTRLTTHLLKSVGADLLNSLVLYASEDSKSSNIPSSGEITPQIRVKLLGELSGEAAETLGLANKSLNGGSVDEFISAIEPSLTAVGLLNRKHDKKKEKQFLQTKREQLLNEVSRSDSHAIVFHSGVLLLFQSVTQTILNASGKFAPTVLSFLKPYLSSELHQRLSQFQDLVLKLLTVGENVENQESIKAALNEIAPVIKEEIITYRKPAEKAVEK